MLIQIGGRKEPGDLVDLLLECHERIRSFTALAAHLASAGSAPAAQVSEAALRVRRYFTEALPRHVADEDQSLWPRLRQKDPTVDGALETMSADHAAHLPHLARLAELCRLLEASPSRLPEVAAELGELARRLGSEFEGHLRLEEEVIFPALRRLLTPAEREAIQQELRQRRA